MQCSGTYNAMTWMLCVRKASTCRQLFNDEANASPGVDLRKPQKEGRCNPQQPPKCFSSGVHETFEKRKWL